MEELPLIDLQNALLHKKFPKFVIHLKEGRFSSPHY